MAPTKIHCDFLEIYGPSWANLNQGQIDCLIRGIQKSQMFGTDGQLRGFVGTARVQNIVGGFFAVQYEDERLYYDRTKRPELVRDTPFERVFFIFFASTGKLLIQNRKFADFPLNMSTVYEFFRSALNQVFLECQIGITIGFYPPREEIASEQFIAEFNRSTRVVRLQVTDPDPNKIPENLEYYNPQRERNDIIRASHRHDYSNFKKVDLEAPDSGNIGNTHLGRDLIIAGKPQLMRYFVEETEHILKCVVPTKLEFYADIGALELSVDEMGKVLDIVRRERSLNLDILTQGRPRDGQLSMFDPTYEAEDDTN